MCFNCSCWKGYTQNNMFNDISYDQYTFFYNRGMKIHEEILGWQRKIQQKMNFHFKSFVSPEVWRPVEISHEYWLYQYYNQQIHTININDDEWLWYIYPMLSGHLLIYWVSSLYVYLYQLQGYQYHVISYLTHRIDLLLYHLWTLSFFMYEFNSIYIATFFNVKWNVEIFLEKVNCKENNLHVLSNTKR